MTARMAGCAPGSCSWTGDDVLGVHGPMQRDRVSGVDIPQYIFGLKYNPSNEGRSDGGTKEVKVDMETDVCLRSKVRIKSMVRGEAPYPNHGRK